MSKKKKLKWLILGFLVLVFLYIVITTMSICTYSHKDDKCNADVAIVLGAGASDDSVSPVFWERINHGIWLYRNGYVNAIIMTGGTGKGNTESEALIAKKYAIARGIPENDIYVEDESHITQENIANAKDIMTQQTFDSAIIVSDPLHMKRSMLMAEDNGLTAYSSPTPTTMYRTGINVKVPMTMKQLRRYLEKKRTMSWSTQWS